MMQWRFRTHAGYSHGAKQYKDIIFMSQHKIESETLQRE